jgi:RNA polymerase sigma-70 factor (ECF subfamily)
LRDNPAGLRPNNEQKAMTAQVTTPRETAAGARAAAPDLEDVYRRHFAFVWRSLLRLGIPRSAVEDVAQDVFLVVRRRLGDYDSTYSMPAWLFGILRRVASEYRRRTGRAQRRLDLLPPPGESAGPDLGVQVGEAAEVVRRFIAGLDEERRMIFVLSELEGLSGTEISEALGVNRNTVYTRLRKARIQFERAVMQHDRTRGMS